MFWVLMSAVCMVGKMWEDEPFTVELNTSLLYVTPVSKNNDPNIFSCNLDKYFCILLPLTSLYVCLIIYDQSNSKIYGWIFLKFGE